MLIERNVVASVGKGVVANGYSQVARAVQVADIHTA
jgi:hypothetical protein